MKFLILLTSFFSLSSLAAQSISSYVITPAGEAIMSPDGALYLSIGEPMNTELNDGDIMISQGFLQVTVAGITLSDEDLLDETITVFPNPTAQELRFRLESDAADYACNIYDMNGRVMQQIRSLNSTAVQVSDYPPGTYYVTLHKDAKVSETIQFIKL